jgi:hypothetical protein
VPAVAGAEWVHRAIDVSPSLLHSGTNDVRIDLAGSVQLDRLHMEFAYPHPRRRPTRP